MTLPAKHYAWFKLANAHPSNQWKKTFFYPFKDKFMRKYASMDGHDLQIIEFPCRYCAGQGCYDCDYDEHGIYDRRKVVLERWQFPNGELYHRPSEWQANRLEYRNTFKGYIRHGETTEAQAYRAFLKLTLRYDRCLFYDLAIQQLTLPMKNGVSRLRWKVYNCRIRLMNFFCQKTGSNDECPF